MQTAPEPPNMYVYIYVLRNPVFEPGDGERNCSHVPRRDERNEKKDRGTNVKSCCR